MIHVLLRFPDEACAVNEKDAINVTSRYSSMFTALITYNCSSINSYELKIFNSTEANCSINLNSSDKYETRTVEVTCREILNQAGRNWTFTIGPEEGIENIKNKTFTITLAPLPSELWGNIIINPDPNPTLMLFEVPNCDKIADPEYLNLQCDVSNESSKFPLHNCTHTCDNLTPGSNYQALLIRLPIVTVNNDDTYDEDHLAINYTTGRKRTIANL